MATWRVCLLACLIGLAGSIGYLGYSVNHVASIVSDTTRQIPIMLDKIEQLEQKVDSKAWLRQVASLQQDIPSILKEVDGINTNIANLNQQLPLVLAQVAVIAMTTVPNVLAEVKVIRESSLPQVLAEVKQLRAETVPNVLRESKAIRTELVPPVLSESAKIRELAPQIIAEANELVTNAERVGREASAGAVEGTLEGIISTPGNLIRKSWDKIDPRDSSKPESGKEQE